LLLSPQNRNVHGKIFGGYIMKMAFEIANVAAVSQVHYLTCALRGGVMYLRVAAFECY